MVTWGSLPGAGLPNLGLPAHGALSVPEMAAEGQRRGSPPVGWLFSKAADEPSSVSLGHPGSRFGRQILGSEFIERNESITGNPLSCVNWTAHSVIGESRIGLLVARGSKGREMMLKVSILTLWKSAEAFSLTPLLRGQITGSGG